MTFVKMWSQTSHGLVDVGVAFTENGLTVVLYIKEGFPIYNAGVACCGKEH